ncbi:VWA domain-containing protein, partial [bacterium]|nr:VWA domain-containing protein [bacterium]
MNNFIMKIILLSSVIILLMLPMGMANGSDNPVIFVFDASGSMWGQINGIPKIQIARDVMNRLLADWDPAMELGLMAYGHRRKGDCEDIELLVPVGSGTGAEIIKSINSINPKGKTPLCEAVKRAAVSLKYVEERATVVLISDGVETCDADPCAVGAELAMAGVDFTVHVIGFDVKGVDQEGLRCLAENTGGLFVPAGSADELHNAISQAVKIIQAPTPEPIDDPGEASLTLPKEAAAGSEFEVIWTGPDGKNDYITIVKPEDSDQTYMNYTYTAKGNPTQITAPDK